MSFLLILGAAWLLLAIATIAYGIGRLHGVEDANSRPPTHRIQDGDQR